MVAVIGEALIDLLRQPGHQEPPGYTARPGGSPFNVAIGLRRLGQPTRLLARFSHDAFGRQLRAHAEANDVDLSLAVAATEPSSLAVVGLDEVGNAEYDFYLAGTADWQWTPGELADLGDGEHWVHAGSLACWTDPSAAVIEARLQAAAADGTVISLDPNVRPTLMGDRAAAVARIERLVTLATVVKASAEDISWLFPELGRNEVLDRWAALGPAVVVITDGPNGAITRTGHDLVHVAGRPIDVVDTVGAGDAFMAGLIDAMVRTGRSPDRLTVAQVEAVVNDAVLVAALTCQRAGADPPTAAQVQAIRG